MSSGGQVDIYRPHMQLLLCFAVAELTMTVVAINLLVSQLLTLVIVVVIIIIFLVSQF